jgi:RNA-directed DNA polymerase
VPPASTWPSTAGSGLSWDRSQTTTIGRTGTRPTTAIRVSITGRINYYERSYKSLLIAVLDQRINPHLVRWACRKHEHLHRASGKARTRLAQIAAYYPGMFAHWRHGARANGSTTGAV